MNREPDFNEIVGAEPSGAERERLRKVHDLLLQAGPPPELPPQLEKPARPYELRVVPRRQLTRRVAFLVAAALVTIAVFGLGYGIGHHSNGSQVVDTLELKGTSAVPHATATLQIDRETSGNWPMTLTASGLPKLSQNAFYEVYLVRDGKPWGSCGTFVVKSGSPVTVPLNAPYVFKHGDTWVVTRQSRNDVTTGQVVLRPV